MSRESPFQDLMRRARDAWDIAVRARDNGQRDSFTWWHNESARLYGGARAVRKRLIAYEDWRRDATDSRRAPIG